MEGGGTWERLELTRTRNRLGQIGTDMGGKEKWRMGEVEQEEEEKVSTYLDGM